MKHFYLCASILLSFANSSYSQEINLGPRATALGNTGVALQEVWSLQSNQAGLTALLKPIASVSYKDDFINPQLVTQSAVIALPLKKSAIGVSLQNYGFSAYNEQKFGFTYARKFGNTLSAALNFNFHQLKIDQYGSIKAVSADVGFQYVVNNKLLIGSHVSNPYNSSYNKELKAEIPVNMELGASYTFSDKVLLNAGIIKYTQQSIDVRCGLEYWIVECLALRGGIAFNPIKEFVGIGYNLHNLMIDMAATADPHLGYSPQLALSYEF